LPMQRYALAATQNLLCTVVACYVPLCAVIHRNGLPEFA